MRARRSPSRAAFDRTPDGAPVALRGAPGTGIRSRIRTIALHALVAGLAAGPALALPEGDASPVGQALAGIYRGWRGSVVQIVSYRLASPPPSPEDGLNATRIEPPRGTLWSSGLVVDGAGHVLTCAEAAQPGDSLELRRTDGRRSGARFLAQDVNLGLSLLLAEDPEGLVPAATDPADPGRTGDWMLIVSFPAGAEEPDLRLGCVGGSMRDPTGRYFPLALKDCRGACGGVVLDAFGRLQGMVVDVRTDRDTDRSAGGNRALLDPLECEWVRALKGMQLGAVAASLEQRSRAPVGFLGVRAEPDTGAASPDRPLGRRTAAMGGVRVAWVLPGSPAEGVGIRAGDHILSLDGQPVGQAAQIAEMIASATPGTRMRIRLLRDGIPLEVTPRLVDRSALEWQERERQLNLLRQKRVRLSIEQLQRRLRVLEQEHARLQ